MHYIQSVFPRLYSVFLRIAEPRVTRLMHFSIYACMLVSGAGVVIAPPASFVDVLGTGTVHFFGAFILAGALSAFIAVLPGLWWLERLGLILMITGLVMYLVILSNLSPSPVLISVVVAIMITFAHRWYDIKGSQVAPREE